MSNSIHGRWVEPLGTYSRAQISQRGYRATSFRWKIYVNPNGDDAYGSGHLFNPYATVARAIKDLPKTTVDDVEMPTINGRYCIEVGSLNSSTTPGLTNVIINHGTIGS
jgi:hypothetical protein